MTLAIVPHAEMLRWLAAHPGWWVCSALEYHRQGYSVLMEGKS